MDRVTCLLLVACLSFTSGAALAKTPMKPRHTPHGLSTEAMQELRDAGVDKYVGAFEPAATMEVGDGWTKHTFDPDVGPTGPDGPVCIAGTEFSVFTRARNPARLLIMLQGGGACWQDFYNCNLLSEDQEPPPPQEGIWDDITGLNPLDDWSVVYMPYCDGSVFSGDNDVADPAWQTYVEGELNLPPGTGSPMRFHRGLRNVTAGIDVAKSMFPYASRILVAGSSAGGVGAAGFAPFLARMAYGNNRRLTVFNDAGPVAINLADTAAIQARAVDWQFAQFFPASCSDCLDTGQGTAIIKWRLDNDPTIREAFYSTDSDLTNRFFLNLLIDPLAYRNLVIEEHGQIHDLHPNRYKRFIRANEISHTALQTSEFYETANGVSLSQWLEDFLVPRLSWADIVEGTGSSSAIVKSPKRFKTRRAGGKPQLR